MLMPLAIPAMLRTMDMSLVYDDARTLGEGMVGTVFARDADIPPAQASHDRAPWICFCLAVAARRPGTAFIVGRRGQGGAAFGVWVHHLLAEIRILATG